MEKFVCVRLVQANAMDLTLFQFDYDLTFAIFFLNADRTIYGRYGTRTSHDEAAEDITLDGFRSALSGALELHQGYPANRAALRGKQPQPTQFKTPEEYPSLRGKFKAEIDYSNKVAQSCMHCHQVRDAERELYRNGRKPIPDSVLFPYPMPNVAGLVLDNREKAKVSQVERGSAAATAGFRAGDEIVRLAGQPLLSVADVQWILHNTGDTASLPAEVLRDGKPVNLTLALANGWRKATDISWRVTTWELRRMGGGGLLVEDLADVERREAGLTDRDLALYVKHVGQYGDHAVAKRAGFQKEDIIIEVDGQKGRMTETAFLAYAMQQKLPGDQLAVTVLRNNKRVNLKLPLQ